jgi:hypothetical protein
MRMAPDLPAHGKPSHAAVRKWADGFWMAAALDPAGWSAYVEDERTRIVLTPFVGFAPFGHGQNFDQADNIEDPLDEAAAAVPRSVLILRLIAQIRAEGRRRAAAVPSAPRSAAITPVLRLRPEIQALLRRELNRVSGWPSSSRSLDHPPSRLRTSGSPTD